MTKKSKRLTQDRHQLACELVLAKFQNRFPNWVTIGMLADVVGVDRPTMQRIAAKQQNRWQRTGRCDCGSKSILCCSACVRSDWHHTPQSRAVQLIDAKRRGILPTKIGRKAIAILCRLPISEIRRLATDAICRNPGKTACPRCGCPADRIACRTCFTREIAAAA